MSPSWLEEIPIDAAATALVPEEPSGDSIPGGSARASSAEWSGSQVFGAGGNSVIRDVGHRSSPGVSCWHCWHHCARSNNALIPSIGRLIFLREGESLHVVCVVRFNLPANGVVRNDLLHLFRIVDRQRRYEQPLNGCCAVRRIRFFGEHYVQRDFGKLAALCR